MRALKILNLGVYFFTSLMLLIIACYHMFGSLLDPTLSFASEVPAEIKSQPGWQLQYFSIDLISVLIAIILIVIGLGYVKKGESSNAWAFTYYIAFLLMIVIATLMIYLLTLDPVIVQ